MSRIEFNCVEQKMEDLRGYCTTTLDPDKNPYRASELNDDEFNFISGYNYALSHATDTYLTNLDIDEFTEIEALKGMVEEIIKKAISDFAQFSYCDLGEMMTSFIDDHESDE